MRLNGKGLKQTVHCPSADQSTTLARATRACGNVRDRVGIDKIY